MDKGYQHVQSANFWAAAGNRNAERHSLNEARFWFEQPQVLEIAGREKADPLLKDVETRLQKLLQKSVGRRAGKKRENNAKSSTPLVNGSNLSD